MTTELSHNQLSQRLPERLIINEPGLYSLILRSRKPAAKDFKRWVTHEVIPTIRKTGGCPHDTKDMTDLEILVRGNLVAQKYIQQLNNQVAEMRPKVEGFELHLGIFDTIEQTMESPGPTMVCE